MTVLIAYASKHGSTREIAERIAEKLRQMGKQAETSSVDTVSDPESFEALGGKTSSCALAVVRAGSADTGGRQR